MKLAFISDIHANLPALEAVWKDMQKNQPDLVYCLGDLVNFAGWDMEVISFIRDHNIPTLQGNHDEGIGNGYSTFKYSYKTEAQHLFGIASIERLRHVLSADEKAYLRSLPFSIKVAYQFSTYQLKMGMVHGSVFSNNEYVLPDAKEEYLSEMLQIMDVDILLMGHTHRPFHKAVLFEEGDKKLYRHVINVGSVGKPKHGYNQSCYLTIELKNGMGLEDSAAIQPNFHFVHYDVNSVLKNIHENGMGNAYDDFLLNGGN